MPVAFFAAGFFAAVVVEPVVPDFLAAVVLRAVVFFAAGVEVVSGPSCLPLVVDVGVTRGLSVGPRPFRGCLQWRAPSPLRPAGGPQGADMRVTLSSPGLTATPRYGVSADRIGLQGLRCAQHGLLTVYSRSGRKCSAACREARLCHADPRSAGPSPGGSPGGPRVRRPTGDAPALDQTEEQGGQAVAWPQAPCLLEVRAGP